MNLGQILSHMIIQHNLITIAAKEYNTSVSGRLYKLNAVYLDNMEILLKWCSSKEIINNLEGIKLLGESTDAFYVYFNKLKNDLYEAQKYGSFS